MCIRAIHASNSEDSVGPRQRQSAAQPTYGVLGVFTLYSLISVEKWMKSL